MTVLAVWSVSAVVSLPGLAISPILGDLNKVFPHATDLEGTRQWIYSTPPPPACV